MIPEYGHIFALTLANRKLHGLCSQKLGTKYSVVFRGFFRRFRRLTRRNSELDEDFAELDKNFDELG